MRPIAPITAATATAAAVAPLLPAAAHAPVWAGLGAAYLGVLGYGTARLESGILGRVRTTLPAGRGEVALTFDDGPDPATTPALLDLLRERGAKATFFVVGERARRFPDLVARCRAEGHALGNHSDRHELLGNFGFARWQRRQIERCQEAIRAAAGVAPRCYRPPFGLLNHAIVPVCRELGLDVVGWSVRSLDTTRRPATAVVARVERGLRDGAIVLLHDGQRARDRVLAVTAGVLDAAAARALRAVALDRG